MKKGSRSPWGSVQTSRSLAAGIVSVSTASHGGIHVSAALNSEIPESLRASNGWYEEDCQAAIPLYFFYDKIKGDALKGEDGKRVERSIFEGYVKDWFPHEWKAYSGILPTAVESRVIAEENFKAENLDRHVVRSAFGSWHEDVPEGFVGVYAKRESDGDTKWFLVAADRYKARNKHGYVIQEGDAPFHALA
jgi:hypothetical protein